MECTFEEWQPMHVSGHTLPLRDRQQRVWCCPDNAFINTKCSVEGGPFSLRTQSVRERNTDVIVSVRVFDWFKSRHRLLLML